MTASGKLHASADVVICDPSLYRQKIRLKSDPKMKEWKFVLSEGPFLCPYENVYDYGRPLGCCTCFKCCLVPSRLYMRIYLK